MDDADTVERKARNLGWVPQEEFRGNPERWDDAETFLKRGEEIMPILKANNRRLHNDLEGLKSKLTEAEKTIAAAQESITALREVQNETTKQAVRQTKTDLKAKIRVAREANDFDMLEELEEQLDNVKEVERQVAAAPAPAAKAPAAPAPAQPQVDPEYVAWAQDNPWVETAPRRVKMLMLAEAADLREDPANKDLKGRPFYEEVAKRVDALLNPRPTSSKVDGGLGSASPSSRSGGGGKRGYKDLSADAKQICDRQAELVVGPGRAYKTLAEWQQSYADQVFAE